MKKEFSLGIIGHPISHSLSPVMHKAAAEHTGIKLRYEPYDVPHRELDRFMGKLGQSGIGGLNVTVPHKVSVMEYMDELSDEAGAMGAINTIICKDGRLTGDNTDGYGFITSITHNGGEDMANKKVFVYGAGGAARAVCRAVAQAGAGGLVIANRTETKAGEIAARLGNYDTKVEVIGLDSNKLVDSVRSADIIINTTSIGMAGVAEKRPPGTESISDGQLVMDIVYSPLETPLLKLAKAKGARTLDGLWMLIHQGARSFKLWTGLEFPVDIVREKLLSGLKKN